jgi:AAA15 family ATPase/GTPase
MRLTGIDIKNFRGFDSLKVEDFGQLNVIVGKNNVGKTAFLEAIALAAGGSEREVIFNLNKIREHTQLTLSSFVSFFYKLSFANTPVIESKWKTALDKMHNRRVQISGKENTSYEFEGTVQDIFGSSSFAVTPVDSKVNRIDVETIADDGQIVLSVQYSPRGNEGKLQLSGKREMTEAVIFLPSTTTSEALDRVSFLKENRLEKPLVAMLQKNDKRVKGLEVIGNQIFIDVDGIEKLVPLWLQGDGLKKSVTIMASIIPADASTIILIDELENGLHYSALIELWRAILTSLKGTKAQFFATTHSEETLRYLIEALEEFPEFKQEIRCFDLANTKLKGFQAYKYTAKGLAGAIENETEIRL